MSKMDLGNLGKGQVSERFNGALQEADGGAWKARAIKSIAAWLEEKITGDIVVIA